VGTVATVTVVCEKAAVNAAVAVAAAAAVAVAGAAAAAV